MRVNRNFKMRRKVIAESVLLDIEFVQVAISINFLSADQFRLKRMMQLTHVVVAISCDVGIALIFDALRTVMCQMVPN